MLKITTNVLEKLLLMKIFKNYFLITFISCFYVLNVKTHIEISKISKTFF